MRMCRGKKTCQPIPLLKTLVTLYSKVAWTQIGSESHFALCVNPLHTQYPPLLACDFTRDKSLTFNSTRSLRLKNMGHVYVNPLCCMLPVRRSLYSRLFAHFFFPWTKRLFIPCCYTSHNYLMLLWNRWSQGPSFIQRNALWKESIPRNVQRCVCVRGQVHCACLLLHWFGLLFSFCAISPTSSVMSSSYLHACCELCVITSGWGCLIDGCRHCTAVMSLYCIKRIFVPNAV